MPPVAVAVAAAAAGSFAAGAGIGGALFGAGILGSFGSAVIADSVFGLITSFAVNQLGGALLGGGGNKAHLGANVINDTGLRQVVRLSDDSQKIIYGRARVGGTLAYIETSSTGPDSDGMSQSGDNLFLHMVVLHAGHEIDAIEEIYLNDDLITLDANGFANEDRYKKDGKSYVRVKHHLGSDTQVADPLLVAEAPSWTSDHRLRGIAYTYVRLQWNPDVFTGGIPTLNVVLRGKLVYDPRTTLTAWSDNAALCVRDYITSRDFNDQPYGFGATTAEVDDTFTIEAANVCEETITKIDLTTIDRYTCNGIVDTGNTPLDNLEALLGSMVGTVTIPKGVFRIYAGAYTTPESTVIDESWLTGNIKSRNRIERQQLFNAVRGLYVAPNKQWQSDDFPAITSTVYEAEDNGERIYTDIQLPFTTDPEAAQRIAKTLLRRVREQITITMPVNYKGLQFAVWDIVKVNNTTRGWNEKVFRIVNMTFDIRQGVVLQLREENSLSYDWNASDAEAVANSADTDLPSPFIVAVPSAVTYDSRAVETVGGDTIYNLVLSWAPYSNSFVTNGGSFEIQYKLSADTEWRPSFYVNGDLTTSDIVSNSVNVSYDLRIRAVNMLGARSNWVTIYNAYIGSGGGVGATQDWGNWTTSIVTYNDWGDWTTPPSVFDDWLFFT